MYTSKKSLSQADRIQLVTLFNAGRLAEVESRSRTLLKKYPASGFVWKVLGSSLHAQGKEALPALQKAVVFLPDDAEAHNNLGAALQASGQLDRALVSYRQATLIKPDLVEAHSNLGNVHKALGQSEHAVASYQQALALKPDLVEVYQNLGDALKSLGQLDLAAASYRQALALKPDLVEVHLCLGNTLIDLGQPAYAAISYQSALAFRPDYVEGLYNLGNALNDLGQFEDAVACYLRATALQPDYVKAHTNLGVAYSNLGQFDDAVVSLYQALQINPDFFEAHDNLGYALGALGQLDDALVCYRRALEIKPDYASCLSNLLFRLNCLPAETPLSLLLEAQRFGELAIRQVRPHSDLCNVADISRRLRVGLVSGDFGNHPVGYFIEGVLAALASNGADQMELIAYPSFFRDDALTKRIKLYFNGWYSVVGLSDERLAQRIRDDGIDILIDLSGHTSHNRLPLFAWKPAPVQVSWLGYFATTGLAAMDYLIADPWTVPESEEAHFTEKIWRLPETYLCFTPPDVDLPIRPLPALSNAYITFGCFNNLTKMNDAVVALWARVLLAVQGSCLYLKTKQLNDMTAQQRVIERFAAYGIDAGRLILEGASPRAELLATYNRVDIALDPFPYPGGTTSAEALWMGVPVLTLAGDRFLSHLGESIMQNAGLPDWIAADADDYVARAVAHAGDIPRLAALRNGLRQQVLVSPLFDAPRFARHFETALRGMWTQWCQQQQEKQS